MKSKPGLSGILFQVIMLLVVSAYAVYYEYNRMVYHKADVTLVAFTPVNNYQFNTGDKLFNVDLTHAIDSGIVAPVRGQTPSGYFTFSFTVLVNKPGKYYYKLYYQNEDYKLRESRKGEYDTLAAENFYGSWEDKGKTFVAFTADKPGLLTVTDSFRIVGNPRNEEKYFGIPMDKYMISEYDLNKACERIRNQPAWFKSIKEKAEKSGLSLDEQIMADAVWVLKDNRSKGNEANHRWKRNPRMGNYSATIVLANEQAVKQVPDYIADISKKGPKGYFVSPYYYLSHNKVDGLQHQTVNKFIKLKATMLAKKGVYVEKYDILEKFDSTHYTADCNCSNQLFHTADFEQSFHGTNKDFVLNTIPLSADVAKDEYTRDDYLKAVKKYKATDFVKSYIRASNKPCETVVAKGDYIEIHNPGNANPYKARKENVGVRTRHGFSYGKITAKVKFPPLINSSNVWTGITQAVWLLYQGAEPWNFRRNSVKGYTPKGSHTADAPRIPSTFYTEIDFEILKTSKYWPPREGMPQLEDAQLTDDIVVSCTNWDLACPDPLYYSGGLQNLYYMGKRFEALRWDPYYQALTSRYAVKHKEIDEHEYYYYQIEWKPKEIIWRIGPSKDDMRVVGYMNDQVTSIPNNQMIMIITQEYHLSDWWPIIPYKQEYIPFNKTDMVGKVYQVEVE